MKKLFTLFALIGLIAATSGCVNTMGSSKTEKETISINKTTMINIDSSAADIEIIPEDRDDISVVLHTFEKGPHLKVSEGKTVHISAKLDKLFSVSFTSSPRLTIYVPKDYSESIEVDNASGDFEINDMTLEGLEIDLSSGNIRGNNLVFNQGTIDLSSGNIELKNVNCENLDTGSDSGNLTLKEFTGAIKGKTSSGNVLIGYKEFTADLDYETISGDITVDFNGSDADAQFDLSTISGNVSMKYDLDDVQEEDSDVVRGTSGEGTYKIDLSVTSGDITIKK